MSRIAQIAGAAALVLLAACGKARDEKAKAPEKPAAAPAAPSQPQRRAGLWTQTVASGGMTQTFRICLDVATAKQLSVLGQQTSDAACSKTSMTPAAGGGWDFSSSCDMGSAGHIESRGVATGDLATNYQVHAVSVTTGASAPSANGKTQMTMSAKWTGPCPADFAPGDMELPGGLRMNIAQAGRP